MYQETNFFIDIIFTVVLIVCGGIIFWAYRNILKRRKIIENTAETTGFDDFFPKPRKIKFSTEAESEEGYHKKLNYQFLIEKMSRKLFLCFFAIFLVSTTFIYGLYRTSLSERIAPAPKVMDQYTQMMVSIMATEDMLEQSQLQAVDSLVDESLKIGLQKEIVAKTIEYEDELVSDVSHSFFNIYYYRYIAVRILVAIIMFVLIRYLVNLYFRIRSDRNDLILKEEALSTLFYVLDEMEGNVTSQQPKYKILEDKIPSFPLLKLFESSAQGKKGNNKVEGIDDLIQEISSNVNTQRDMMSSMKSFFEELLEKSRKNTEG